MGGRKDDGALARRIGRRIRELRAALGLTLEGAAPQAGITWKYWGEIERGERTDLPLATLPRIVEDGLGASMTDVFASDALPPKPRSAEALPADIRDLIRHAQGADRATRKRILQVVRGIAPLRRSRK